MIEEKIFNNKFKLVESNIFSLGIIILRLCKMLLDENI